MSKIIDIETPIVITNSRYYSQKAKLMLKAMFAIEPVIVNVIALALCATILYILNSKSFLPNIGKYHTYLNYSIELLACYQMMISAKKSLILPIGTLVITTTTIAVSRSFGGFPLAINFLKEVALISVIGTGVSIFYMR